MNRISKVNTINIKNLAFTSNLIIGDSYQITPNSMALAVQREVSTYWDNEGDLSQFGIFSQELPLPTITEDLRVDHRNENPLIKVNSISILGVSNAAVVHIGTTKHVEGVSRTKHIRKLLERHKKRTLR